MEVGGAWRQPAIAECALSHPENFSLRKEERKFALFIREKGLLESSQLLSACLQCCFPSNV